MMARLLPLEVFHNASNWSTACWIANLGSLYPCIFVVWHEKGDSLFPIEDCGTMMSWLFVVVNGDFCIFVEPKKEVSGNVCRGELCKPCIDEIGIRRIIVQSK